MCETKTGDEVFDEIRAYSIKDADIAHDKPWFMAVFILIGGVFSFVRRKTQSIQGSLLPNRAPWDGIQGGPRADRYK